MDENPQGDDAAHEAAKPTPGKHRLAGMALRNGVLVIGPTMWAAAVRTPSGTIATASRPRPTLGDRLDDLPAVRGPARLVEMLLVLPALRRALPEARLSFESREILATTAAGSTVGTLARRRFGIGAVSELAGSVTSLGLVLSALRGGEISQYHGAEHKVIGAYEQDIPPVDASREHERCGTHLAVPMLLANALALQGARMLLPQHVTAARLLGMAAGMAAATELGRAMQRNTETSAARLASRLGMHLQSVASTSEPTREQLDVAEMALAELLRVEREPFVPEAA